MPSITAIVALKTEKVASIRNHSIFLLLFLLANHTHHSNAQARKFLEDRNGYEYTAIRKNDLSYRCVPGNAIPDNSSTGRCIARPTNFYRILSDQNNSKCIQILDALNEEFHVRNATIYNPAFWAQVLLTNRFSILTNRLEVPNDRFSSHTFEHFETDINNNGIIETVFRWVSLSSSVYNHSLLFEDGITRDLIQNPITNGRQFVRDFFTRNNGRTPLDWERFRNEDRIIYTSVNDYPNFDQSYVGQYSTRRYYEPLHYQGENYILMSYSIPRSFYPHVYLLHLSGSETLSIECQFAGNFVVLTDNDYENL